jgi:hypothetical protein
MSVAKKDERGSWIIGILILTPFVVWLIYDALGGKAFFAGFIGLVVGVIGTYIFLSAYTNKLDMRSVDRAKYSEYKLSQAEKKMTDTEEQYGKYREELGQQTEAQRIELEKRDLLLIIAEKEVLKKHQELEQVSKNITKQNLDFEQTQEQKRLEQEARLSQLQKGLQDFQ